MDGGKCGGLGVEDDAAEGGGEVGDEGEDGLGEAEVVSAELELGFWGDGVGGVDAEGERVDEQCGGGMELLREEWRFVLNLLADVVCEGCVAHGWFG